MDDVCQAVVTAHKLHIGWSVRLDATLSRSCALAPRLAAKDGVFGDLLSWVLVLNDGVHVIHSDMDNRVQLRRVDTGEIVWESHLKSGALGCLDYGFYEDDVILIFDVPESKYVGIIGTSPAHYFQILIPRRMVIWRYKRPGNCNPVCSLDIASPLGFMWATRVNFIRGVYVGCLIDLYKNRHFDRLRLWLAHWRPCLV